MNEGEEMNCLVKRFFVAEIKKHPFSIIKVMLMFIPLMSIIGMFATANLIPLINQKAFLMNSEYEWIAYTDHDIQLENSFANSDRITIATIVSDDGVLVYRPEALIELFVANEYKKETWDESYFNSKNLLQGSYDHLASSNNDLDIALSYNAAKRLNKKIGDSAHLLFFNSENEVIYYPVRIQTILKPFDSGSGGIAVAIGNESFNSFLESNNLHFRNAFFGTNAPTDLSGEIIYKGRQINSVSSNILSTKNFPNILMAIMGIVVIFLVINREINFFIKNRLRTLGILMALGASEETINSIIWNSQILQVVIASVASGFIYKYFLMEMFVGEYINIATFLLILFIYIAVSLFSIRLAVNKINVSASNYSVIDIISKKPKETY